MSTLCDLCASDLDTRSFDVPPGGSITVCGICGPQLAPGATLDPKHWFCLQGAIWSEEPAVQVVAYRMLKRLSGEAFAQDLMDQAYLEPDVLAWAEADSDADDEGDSPAVKTVDSNGVELFDGDTVTLIKGLVVKGANFTAKRGTVVKNIRLTDNPLHVDGKVNKIGIVLVAAFLKKVG